MSDDSARSRVCTKCGQELPATTEYFYRHKKGKYGLGSRCKPCHLEGNKAWASSHPARVAEYQRCWVEANRERTRGYCRKYDLSHRESRREKTIRYRSENPEAVRRSCKAWSSANPEKIRIKASNRRAKAKSAGGKHTKEDIDGQLLRQKGKCFYCQNKLGKKYHIDHVTPLSRGGSNGPENIVVACPSCNLRKSDKHPMEFAGILL